MYRACNARLTSHGHSIRLLTLAAIGKAFGIQFHVEGVPFGAKAKPFKFDADPNLTNYSGSVLGAGHITASHTGGL